MEKRGEIKANRLIKEKSPYLLQHAYNPVDWFPWADEAFARAREENKPVFLSIGYSTCHWCHVMEKDSFEDPEVADLLNRHFIAVKVDREERPDLDQKYMAACQALTGQGGWPLSVFLTPERKPFYAATFIPKNARYGLNGMVEILPRLSEYWQKDRNRVIQAGDELVAALAQASRTGADKGQLKEKLPGKELLQNAYGQLQGAYDSQYGGFGNAPKFPAPHQLIFLLRYWKRTGEEEALQMAVKTLQAMHHGGIFDQLAYGIHRYSVDERWLVPHFEKMLYDQALTTLAAVEAFEASGSEDLAAMAEEIITYVLNELTAPGGAFYAAEDADSEGEEGTFYVWDLEELQRLLGTEGSKLVADYYGISADGNFEKGKSILFRKLPDEAFAASRNMSVEALKQSIDEARSLLLAYRSRRERPFRDDKIITSWNGLFIAALARAAVVLKRNDFLTAAEQAMNFIMDEMVSPEGVLFRRYREGEAAIPGFLDDYANLAWANLELFVATKNDYYLKKAESLSHKMLELFYDREGKFFYSTFEDSPAELMPEAEAYDGAFPSGVSVTAMNLLQLGRLLQDESLKDKGEKTIKAQLENLERSPTGFCYLLAALDYALNANEGSFHCTPGGNCDRV